MVQLVLQVCLLSGKMKRKIRNLLVKLSKVTKATQFEVSLNLIRADLESLNSPGRPKYILFFELRKIQRNKSKEKF